MENEFFWIFFSVHNELNFDYWLIRCISVHTRINFNTEKIIHKNWMAENRILKSNTLTK